MRLPALPLLTSFGALLFEFSLAQYLAMALGNSAFGYSFVVGSFLLAMGAGSWIGDRIGSAESLRRLVQVELLLIVLCLVSLPSLAWLTGASKSWLSVGGHCRALICEAPGLILASTTFAFLVAAGLCVGAEIPLFLKSFPWKLGSVLAADYLGAFLAGLVFPFVSLPELGLCGTLALAGLCHGVSALVLSSRLTGRSVGPRVFSGLGVLLCAAFLFQSEAVERKLLVWITTRADADHTDVLSFHRTKKQTVLYVEDSLNGGKKDRRLYLDGFLQFSSDWNQNSYHRAMALPARRAWGRERARVLILGGGDGLAANTLLADFPEDEVRIVDFDGELLSVMKRNAPLKALAPRVWGNSRVQMEAADAFWYLRAVPGQWDLILVDFPHGVGDAAAAKVESWEFFRDLHRNLSSRGRVVLHHERFGSQSQRCVEETLREAGFSTQAIAVSDEPYSEAMLIGTKADGKLAELPRLGQTTLSLRCQFERRFFGIWIGA